MKCVLIQAELDVKYLSVPPPIGIAYLASYLQKNGIDVSIIDAYGENLDFSAIEEKIKIENPDFIGVSAVTPTINKAIAYCKATKRFNKNIKTILGGTHPSVFPGEILKENKDVDFVVCGEGELTAHELLDAQLNGNGFDKIDGLAFRDDGNINITNRRDYIKDLDAMPFPAWDLIPYESYRMKIRKGTTLYMLGSRGCPFSCDYCAISSFWKAQRRRSPENIMSEIEHFSGIYDIFTIVFFDPMFCLKREWVISICKEILQRGYDKYQYIADGGIGFMDPEMLSWMKKANFKSLQFGLEFGSQRVLNLAHKKIKVKDAIESVKMTRAAGINISLAIMMGYPGEKKEDVEESINLARKLKPDHFGVTNVIPYPGTKLYNCCRENGLLRSDNWDDFSFTFWTQKRHLIKLEHLTDEDLIKFHKKAVRKIRYSLNYIAKTVFRYPEHFFHSIFFIFYEKLKKFLKFSKK